MLYPARWGACPNARGDHSPPNSPQGGAWRGLSSRGDRDVRSAPMEPRMAPPSLDPAGPSAAGCVRLYVAGLPPDMLEVQLKALFEQVRR